MQDKNNTLGKDGYELVHFCEFDKYAAKSYCAIHDTSPDLNLGDITKVDETKLNEFNMICGGSPCFVAGTLVLTEYGHLPIEKVIPGDKVITHNNRYENVVKTMVNKTNRLIGFKPSVSEPIYCTPEHPIYIRKKFRNWVKGEGYSHREFTSPEWRLAGEIGVGDYVGTAINRIEEIPKWDGIFVYKNQYNSSMDIKNELEGYFNSKNFWYIVGRYIGDGWVSKDDKRVVICCAHNEVEEITDKLKNLGIKYCIGREKSVCKVTFTKAELCVFLKMFGHGAKNKHLTREIINLPTNYLESFLDGYIESDGTFTQGRYKITSISKALIYDVAQCVAKVYHRPYSIYHTKRPNTHVIEGRVVNQHDTYQLCWKSRTDVQDKAFYEDGYIWSPITKVEEIYSDELVYNFEVENDNSYMVQGVIVHNCQDFSVAGKQAGSRWVCKSCGHEYNPLTVHYSERYKCPACGAEDIDKSRSSLLVEWLRVIRHNKPKWGIYENVKNIVGKQFKETFDMFINELHEYGYNTYYDVLNAKDYGVPQNRERVYLIIIQNELDNGKFKFPEPFDNGIRLRDVLEDKVDQKYYINTPRAKDLIDDLIKSGKLDKLVSNTIRQGGERKCRQASMGSGSYGLNSQSDGSCRTIKSQYSKTSVVNFERQGTFGATGVINIELEG